MPTLRQTLAGAAQFDGATSATGLFVFTDRFASMKRSTRLVINGVSYTEVWDAGAPLTTDVQVRLTLSGGAATDYVLMGRGLAANIVSPLNGNAEFWTCGRLLPREPGNNGVFWAVQVFSANKRLTAMVSVDYAIATFPETDPRDSQQ